MRIRSSKSNQKLGCTFKQLKMVSRRKYAVFGKIKKGAQWLYISSLVIDSNPFLHGFDMLYLTVLVIIPCFLLAYSCHCGISCLPIFGKNCPTMSERNRPAFLFKPTWQGWNSLYNEWMCNTAREIEAATQPLSHSEWLSGWVAGEPLECKQYYPDLIFLRSG